MNFDIGAVLTRAWQITWKNKVLWLYGSLLMLASFLMIPLMLILMIASTTPGLFGGSINDAIFMLIVIAGFFLFMLVLYPVSVLLQGALTVGVLHGERDEEKLSFMNMLQESYPFFWRILGTMLVFTGGMMLVFLVYFLIVILISVVTFGLGILCLMPFSLLQYPLMLVWYVCMEQSMAAVVADNMDVMDAIKHSWQLFRKNILAFVLMSLVLYFGASMITSFVMMPIMLPFFFLPIAMESMEFNKTILWIAIFFSVVFVPIFAIFQGGVMALMKSGWVLTYLRLTRPANEDKPELQAVVA